jgi:pimeloyl-ACP methyl ester carboxylesterase
MNVFYLHGFASSARSTKAAYLSDRFESHGIALHCPDFNEPAFFSLTLTRMLDQVARDIAAVDSGPVVLIGSSLGAVVAIHTAARLAGRIDRLVLLAPAVLFPRDADRVLGADKVAEWRRSGTLDVWHHGDCVSQPLNYAFFEDALRYDAVTAPVTQPTRVFQGLRDKAVDAGVVQEWAAPRPNVRVTLLDDDHQLHASLPEIWREMTSELGLT